MKKIDADMSVFLSKLASYLAHEAHFFEKRHLDKGQYFAEYILMLQTEHYPPEIWTMDTIRFIRKRVDFFPSIKMMISLLNEYRRLHLMHHGYMLDDNEAKGQMSRRSLLFYNHFKAHYQDQFQTLARHRPGSKEQTIMSQIRLVAQCCPPAYRALVRDGFIKKLS